MKKLQNSEGKTIIFVAQEEKILGLIAVADILKKTSADAVKNFQKLGVEVVMLTGDNKLAAKNIAEKLGIKKFFAGR